MVASVCDEKIEQVGAFDMSVRFGSRSQESDKRWAKRSDILTAWLMDQWHREQSDMAERN